VKRALALAVAFAVGPGGVALAQPPDNAAPVAGPTSSGARLFVWDERGVICAAVLRPRDRGHGSSCGPAPERLRGSYVTSRRRRSGLNYAWGAVDPQVASVEVVFASGRRLAAETTSGDAYRGRWAGRLRFFLIEARWPRADYPLYVRLLGEGGQMLGAVDAGSYDEGRPRKTVVARGRVANARWALRAFTRPAHAPLPSNEERVVTERCLEIDVSGPGNFPQSGGSSCDNPDLPIAPLLDIQRTCGPIGLQIVGMVPRGAGVVAVLGDGRRVRPELVSLPRRFGDVRAFALALAPHVALRSLATVEGGRREVQIRGVGPGVADCPNTSSGYLFGFDFELPTYGPGPAVLQLRDHGELLCATLGAFHPDNRDCGRPPLDEEGSWALWDATPEGTTVAGVVAPAVGSVEVLFEDAATQVVPVTAASGYTGAYRDLIRVFSITIPGEHQPRALRFYGLDGRRLYSNRVYSEPEFVQAPRDVLRTASGWRLAAGIVGGGALAGRRLPCLQLTRGEPSDEWLACTFADAKQVRATCRPRRTLVYGQVDSRVRRVEVRTTRGTFFTGTTSLRKVGIRGRAFVAELPASSGLRWVIIRGKRTRRLYAQLPPPQRQCGYSESISFP
jgi:hypothetical protein